MVYFKSESKNLQLFFFPRLLSLNIFLHIFIQNKNKQRSFLFIYRRNFLSMMDLKTRKDACVSFKLLLKNLHCDECEQMWKHPHLNFLKKNKTKKISYKIYVKKTNKWKQKIFLRERSSSFRSSCDQLWRENKMSQECFSF